MAVSLLKIGMHNSHHARVDGSRRNMAMGIWDMVMKKKKKKMKTIFSMRTRMTALTQLSLALALWKSTI